MAPAHSQGADAACSAPPPPRRASARSRDLEREERVRPRRLLVHGRFPNVPARVQVARARRALGGVTCHLCSQKGMSREGICEIGSMIVEDNGRKGFQ